MATFYTDSNERVAATAAPMLYLREHIPSSYQDTPVLPGNMMMYMNPVSYSDTLGIDSNSQHHQQQEILSNFNGSRLGDQEFNSLRDFNPSGVLQNGLSLSLGTQIPGGFQMSSAPFRNPSSGTVSFLSPNPSVSENENSRNGDYVPHGYNGIGTDLSGLSRTIPHSRYLKAAQQLLEEVVNVRKALKQPEDDKERSGDENRSKGKGSEGDNDGGPKNDEGDSSTKESSGAKELSHSERQELQNKLTKLLTMLDEVDKRYKQYYHQMQFVVSSFDSIAGPGAAKPYTALALQRISQHFRCLRDAINGQISATRKALGEQDSSSGNNGIPRLRYVDQQLRQQRALQQLGMMQQHAAWRPQRGLPESSVSILRAWLFEHFLHPYPKDSDKILLASQTGLSRSQVSNWFINARVRLWKPMVEEMYKEEIGDPEMDSISSSENASKTVKGDAIRSSEERGEDNVQRTSSTAASERYNSEKPSDPKLSHIPSIDMGPSGGVAIEADYYVQSSLGNPRFVSEAGNEYQMFGNGTGGVSLTLGLQHFEGGTVPFSSTMGHGFVPMRGDEFYGATGSSIGTEPAEFEVVSNGGTQHHRLRPGQHMLHDFVA